MAGAGESGGNVERGRVSKKTTTYSIIHGIALQMTTLQAMLLHATPYCDSNGTESLTALFSNSLVGPWFPVPTVDQVSGCIAAVLWVPGIDFQELTSRN